MVSFHSVLFHLKNLRRFEHFGKKSCFQAVVNQLHKKIFYFFAKLKLQIFCMKGTIL
jgi:hypothetical protein